MSHKKCARDFGIVLFLIGLLACIPGLTINSYFLGAFKVNLYTNILHLATGLIALLLSHSSLRACKIYFQLIGIVYGMIVIRGFAYGNMAVAWIHLFICLLTLYWGFLYKSSRIV